MKASGGVCFLVRSSPEQATPVRVDEHPGVPCGAWPAQAGPIHSIPANVGPDRVSPATQPMGPGESSQENARSTHHQRDQDRRATLVPAGEAMTKRRCSINNLALSLESTGHFEDAEPLYRQAMEITRKALGEEHPEFATNLNNLAGLLTSTSRHKDAEPLFRQAMEIRGKVLGEEHPDYVESVKNLYK
ncbi:MAG: tetratricopeptide repeat protein [Candidatus Hydrogenedentes bacterium]|nr:tetratricopeptide repeat protein [Candidatus Hydrogenedentota bacterium]